MAQTLLKVDNINVFYGNIHAVKDVSFEVNEGEIVTLIGANGAGKSTTLKTISGLLHPKTGDVLYKGKSIKGVRAHKIVEAGLAQVPEGRHVFLHMTVEENLDMGAYTQPASTIAPNKEKVFELFPRLKERRKQLAGTMSGGEQQMLAMGRALMSNASMLMLDEPSMGLSPLLVQEIFDIIQNIHKEGMTILLGVKDTDTLDIVPKLAEKCAGLRIFKDENDKLNLSAKDLGYSALVVSQFTLYGDTKKGFRPSFIKAARPPLAVDAYELFLAEMNRQGLKDVQHGEFGADMQVSLVNEGPCTIVIDTDEWHKGEK